MQNLYNKTEDETWTTGTTSLFLGSCLRGRIFQPPCGILVTWFALLYTPYSWLFSGHATSPPRSDSAASVSCLEKVQTAKLLLPHNLTWALLAGRCIELLLSTLKHALKPYG